MRGINAYRTRRQHAIPIIDPIILVTPARLNTPSNLYQLLVTRFMTSDYVLYVKGNEIHMNEFVSRIIHDVLMAILSNLRDIDLESITKIEID